MYLNVNGAEIIKNINGETFIAVLFFSFFFLIFLFSAPLFYSVVRAFGLFRVPTAFHVFNFRHNKMTINFQESWQINFFFLLQKKTIFLFNPHPSTLQMDFLFILLENVVSFLWGTFGRFYFLLPSGYGVPIDLINMVCRMRSAAKIGNKWYKITSQRIYAPSWFR